MKIGRFLWPYRWRIAVALVALVVTSACVLALGRGLQHVVDRGFGSGDPRLLDQALAAMIAVVVVFALATWVRFYFMMTTGERVVTDLRRAVFDHILGLEPAFFESTRTGELISRLTNDTTLLQQVIGYGLSMFVRNGLMMAGAAVMLFVTSWKLAALVLVGAPATLLPILLLGRRVRRLSRASQDRVADVSAYVDEAIHEIRTVQAYAHEEADRAGFARHAEAAYRTGVERISYKAFLIAAVILIAFSAVGIILWIGGHDVLAGRLTQGELAAFVFYAAVVAAGAGTVAEVWGELQRAAGATERLVELLDTPPHIVAPPAPAAAPTGLPLRINFEEVRFAYPARPAMPALERFTL
ncbi:MAG: ABC transporter transmembrane domain-containing protein [Burkholderiales bacterium]